MPAHRPGADQAQVRPRLRDLRGLPRAALWAADEIKKRTDGRYEIQVFPASQLGKETDINQGLTLGTVDIIYTGQAFAARTLPARWRSAARPSCSATSTTGRSTRKSDLLKELMEGYYKKGGNKPLAVTYYGVRHTTANKPSTSPRTWRA